MPDQNRPYATAEAVARGHAIYTNLNLRVVYDPMVLYFSNRFLWKCPTPELVELYRQLASLNHLDAGVGTGYYTARLPRQGQRLGLIDIDERCLARATERATAETVETYCENLLEPFEFAHERYDSLGATYLMHCMPGTMDQKSVAFDHLKAALYPGAAVFGASIVQGDVPVNAGARKLMAVYNRKGIFSNEQDTAAALERNLKARFEDVEVWFRGCVAVFTARNP
ncbi:bifunctional 2-polyprenyl-6-hydroxyphenol methylase/3-demethylubiquinol 3-O-methyltransferase UbiG [Pseudoruegeria sp. HB172150]|uniref:class I SAM-dependent methyltransferase n=1 Tax=Pseudoruegeria sp. HB172150 TaxID=2721164 RepID=UPI001557BB0C|nr:class I SAM-dependent methyltransferase [Pseudoruegeria sp. HB172150]